MRRRRLGLPCAALVVAVVAMVAGCGENISPIPGQWSQVAAGDGFTCALAQDASAWCWGEGTFGQLGNNATISQSMPVKVAGGYVFRAIAAGSSHACAITTAGAAWCWGVDDFGELGLVTGICNRNVPFITCSAVPVAAGGGLTFSSIVAAAYTSCALAPGGAAWCWGSNDHGQLGTGAAVGTHVSVPAGVAGGRLFRAITLDVNHACALTAQNGLYCWGSNDFGQLAADTLTMPRCGSGFYCASSPVASATGLAASLVSAGSKHTCAVASSGGTWCWGSNEYGGLGDPAAPGGTTLVRVLGGHAFTSLSAGADHTCALDQAGAAFCWGLDTYGQLGVSAPSSACPASGSLQLCETSPVLAQGVPPLAAVSAGSGHTCGLTPDGEIWCWGRGTEGQLGDGQSASNAAPVRVVRP